MAAVARIEGGDYRTAGICEEYLEQGTIRIGRPSQGLAASFQRGHQFSVSRRITQYRGLLAAPVSRLITISFQQSGQFSAWRPSRPVSRK